MDFVHNDKIYISRANASSRRIANELELTTELKKVGFIVVHLELLSPYEQAYIFNKAKMIIGPHGSGFVNLLFSNPGCILIEIDHGTDPIRSFYKRMAALMSCKYVPFYVDETTEEHLDDDMNVDIVKLMQFFHSKKVLAS